MDELIDDKDDAPEIKEELEPEIIYEGEPGYEEEAKAELDVEEPEAEDEAIEVEDKSKKPKNRIPAKTRINQMSRQYHEQLRRAEEAEKRLSELRDENERLLKSYESQNKAVITSQESMLDAHIKSAKQMKAKAIEEGDVEAQLVADEALASAVSDKRNLDAWKMQQKLYEEAPKSPTKQRQEVRQEEPYLTPEAEEWVSENSWFDGRTDDFDLDLHNKAMAYAQHLDTRYQRSGVPEKIMSYEYFDEINRYMNKFINPKAQNRQGDLVMNRPRNTVAPVQRAHVPGQREVLRMSREDQEMARAMGWDDKKWLHYKKEADRLEAQGRLKSATGNSR